VPARPLIAHLGALGDGGLCQSHLRLGARERGAGGLGARPLRVEFDSADEASPATLYAYDALGSTIHPMGYQPITGQALSSRRSGEAMTKASKPDR
jgi:hypothetical protein